ncbi:MAG TPA: alcohol dehydrogenase catalytic domain-containing protein [Dehalococcoidia bacterium]|nr:alcohol dehydrogenase catalytic domain-containing protein [Dehalococcoidia bacterium]
MKAIFKTKREPGIEVFDVDTPEVGDADILVKVKAASLCGSDVHAYEWTPNYEFLPLPVILGHEFAGDIVQVGAKVTTVSVGDRITAMPGMPCGSCLCCQVGKPDACASRFALGLTGNGAFAEYMRITAGATIFKLPENLDYETASLTEPLAVVMRAVDLSGIKVGQKTAVLGPGPIGLFAVQLLKAAGAGLIMTAGTGNDSMRLKIARELGADMTINVEKEDIVGMAKELTGGGLHSGLDVVFEASGNPKSVTEAVRMVKPGGKVILIGIHSRPAEIPTTELVRQSKTIIGAYGYDAEIWQRCIALLTTGKVQVKPMITHRLPLTQADEGFEAAISRKAAKVIFVP